MVDQVMMLSWVQKTELSTAIRQSGWAVMALESVHLVGLALLGGSAVIVALAALRDEGLRGLSVPVWVTGLAPVWWAGLLLMAVSGVLITLSMPFKYYDNAAFRWKMALLILGLAGSWVLYRMSRGGGEGRWRAGRRVLAVVVLVLWAGVGCCGRLIGFL